MHYRYRQTPYHISVRQTLDGDRALSMTLDGVALSGAAVPLLDDGLEHRIDVEIHATLPAWS